MKGIHTIFLILLECLPIDYTTLELATYLEEVLGNMKYHHQDRGIPNTRFMSALLDHSSRTNRRDPSIFNNLTGEFAHKLHYFKVGHQPRSSIRKHESIITRTMAFQTQDSCQSTWIMAQGQLKGIHTFF
jgi:hypothetical protein